MQQQTQKYLEKQSARLRPRKGQRIEVDSDQDDQGNILDEHEEGENIRLHVLNVDDVLDMLADGRINNAMSIIALQWFQLNRERLASLWS